MHFFRKEYKAERVQQLPQMIQDCDIVSLNEAFQVGSRTVTNFVSACKLFGFKDFVSIKSPSFFSKRFMDGGVLLMSKYPIVLSDSIIYQDGTTVDDWAAKGAVYGKILLQQNDWVHVFATHTQACYKVITSDLIRVRKSQLSELRNFIAKYANDQKPAFLLGDLNIDARIDGEYDFLTSNLQIPNKKLRDLCFETNGGHPITLGDLDPNNGNPIDTVLTNPDDYGSKQRLDYIFMYETAEGKAMKHESYVKNFFVENKHYVQLSDHYGITSEISFIE